MHKSQWDIYRNKKVIIRCAGAWGKRVLLELWKQNVNVFAFCDSNFLNFPNGLGGLPVLSLEKLESLSPQEKNEMVVVIATDTNAKDAILQEVQNFGFSETQEVSEERFPLRDYDFYKTLPQEEYEAELKIWFQLVTGKILDLENPKTFNEKIQWLKLYDSTPLKTRLADKYLVRDWVAEQIGEEHLIPLLGVWNSFDEIDFEKLPEKFALKANHGSGWNIIVKDKSMFDHAQAKVMVDEWMKVNFAYVCGLELHYTDISPRIIAESYIQNMDRLYDYRFYCFGGEPKYIWVDSESESVGHVNQKRNVYDMEWNLKHHSSAYPCLIENVPKPTVLPRLIAFSKQLSKAFTFVRVDFYVIENQIYFGEMTFTPQSGTGKWVDEEVNRLYGDLIELQG